ncbi:MAG: hypothetical protein NXI22_18750, partial [bacterium]|nr:hypothetical protein [bacterium]
MVKVAFAENDEVIQDFKLNRLHSSFNERILIRRSDRSLHDFTFINREDFFKRFDENAVAIAHHLFDQKSCFVSLLHQLARLRNHATPMGFERTRSTKHAPRSNVHNGQRKRLTQASRRPDHLAEEINLPERIEMGLEKLVPLPATSLWIGRKSFFPENVANRRFRDVSDAELFEFSQDSAESPTILPGQPNHDFADLLKRDGSA